MHTHAAGEHHYASILPASVGSFRLMSHENTDSGEVVGTYSDGATTILLDVRPCHRVCKGWWMAQRVQAALFANPPVVDAHSPVDTSPKPSLSGLARRLQSVGTKSGDKRGAALTFVA